MPCYIHSLSLLSTSEHLVLMKENNSGLKLNTLLILLCPDYKEGVTYLIIIIHSLSLFTMYEHHTDLVLMKKNNLGLKLNTLLIFLCPD